MTKDTDQRIRERYAKPQLTVYGRFSQVTASGSNPFVENFSGPPGQRRMNRL
jgi:hypothetical protein